MNWQFGNETNIIRTLGAKQKNNVDLIALSRNEMRIATLFTANSMPPKVSPGKWKSGNKINIICTVYLKYDEGVSQDYTINIRWDGEWNADAYEMKKHIKIELI